MTELLLPDVPAGDEIEREARASALARLRAEMAAEPRAASRRRRRRGGRHRAAIAVAAGLAVAAAAAVAVTSGLDEGRVSPAASAAAVLRQAADAAARGPDGALAPGHYLHVRRTAMEPKVIQRGGERFRVFIRYVDEDWTARDGSGRNRSAPASPAFPTAADQAAWKRAGSPSQRAMVGNYLPILDGTDHMAGANPRHAFPARAGGMGLSYAEVRALPGDPAQLARQLPSRSQRAYTPATRAAVANTQRLEWIGRLLGGAPLSGAQRAALLRVAAGVPGVRISHDAVDRLGRHGTAVRLDAEAVLDPSRPPHQALASHRSITLVVDPRTGALLGTRATIADAAGKVLGDYGAVYRSDVTAGT